MRHAKSSWSDPTLPDLLRPLNKRGINNSTLMAHKLQEMNIFPEYALCSYAERTKQTWGLMSKVFNTFIPTKILPELYDTSISEVLLSISKIPKEITTLLVLFHNPTCELVYTNLTQQNEVISTANVLILESVDKYCWKDILTHPSLWETLQVLRPKEL